MRAAVITFLALLAGCADSCSFTGTTFFSHSGWYRPSGGAPAVVGIDWPFTPTLLWEAGKETSFLDGDPVETPTQFGSQTTVLPTMATLAKRHTYQDPCDVGPAIPCYYGDGGDTWRESAANPALAYLHDGTGMTCYVVRELATGTGSAAYLLGTQTSSSAVGYRWANNSSSPPRLVSIVGNGSSSIIASLPSSGSGSINQTIAAYVVHGTARTSDFAWGFRGITNSNQANYSGTPSSSNPSAPLSIGANAVESAGTFAVHYLFALACDDDIHSSSMITATLDAIEAVTGVLPQ